MIYRAMMHGSPDAPAAAAFFIRRKSSASQQSGSFSGLE
jgi:hypothetical protein